ncbi:hypothetical protein OC844_003747 [Tilletia horrida]|nr:hypothetical protein OC844_003747 [Tilletia horrida]
MSTSASELTMQLPARTGHEARAQPWERLPVQEGTLQGAHYRFAAPTPIPPAEEEEDAANTFRISLLRLVQVLVGARAGAHTVSAHVLKLNLGRLRAAQLAVDEYNAAPSSPVAQFHAANLFSSLGVAPSAATSDVARPLRIEVEGLPSLIDHLDSAPAPTSGQMSERHDPDASFVSFDDLDARFRPGILVSYPTSLGHASERIAARVRSCHFEERRTAFGNMERSFNVELETVVPLGSQLGLVSFVETFSGWSGERRKRIADLVVRPISSSPSLRGDRQELDAFVARGQKCLSLLGRARDAESYRFLAYDAGGFFPHAQERSTASSGFPASMMAGTRAGSHRGRIVIDGEMALALGHHPSQGSTEADLALLNAAGRYKRSGRHAEGLLVFDVHADVDADSETSGDTTAPAAHSQFPAQLVPLIWPALCGFSMSAKRWGHVLVSSLEPIQFNRAAFDQLVLSPDRKRLIHAVVNAHQPTRNNNGAAAAQMHDIIASKSGGTVFLLHGAPGVGKTLTAEAVAEMLGRPVYYVTMGELGTAVEHVEARLGQVLQLCAAWRAVVLIDEADVFLERRRSGGAGDILRNALVCVLLRLIEYFEGILFLTTNRVASFDPAVESRVTVALRYDALDAAAREQVWRNLVNHMRGDGLTGGGALRIGQLDFARLAEHDLNGRQIKNTLRLALALAADSDSDSEDVPLLSQELLELTLRTTLIGRQEMQEGVYEL